MATAKALSRTSPGTVRTLAVPNTRDGGNHPHVVLCYEPAGAVQLWVLGSHGGGADGPSQAQQTFCQIGNGTPTAANAVWGLMAALNMAVWFPSYGIPNGVVDATYNPNGADLRNVSNALGTLGVRVQLNHGTCSTAGPPAYDDIQFLKDCCTYAQSLYGNVVRAHYGHSDGGILAQRSYREHLFGMFSTYHFVCAPPATFFEGVAFPAIVKPTQWFFGLKDKNIGILGQDNVTNNFLNTRWAQQPSGYGKQNIVYPAAQEFIGGAKAFEDSFTAYNTFKSLPPETFNWADAVITTGGDGGNRYKFVKSGGKNEMTVCELSPHKLTAIELALGTVRRPVSILKNIAAFAYANAAG